MRLDEHIDSRGILNVPVKRSMDRDPVREGWKPYFVNVNLDRDPQKIVRYKREEG